MSKKGKSDEGHAEWLFGGPNKNWVSTIVWKIGSICISGHRSMGKGVKHKEERITRQSLTNIKHARSHLSIKDDRN